jgi:hypothetical protein
LLDPTVCPGPFDVVVERRCVQWFGDHERGGALSALSRRLGEVGIFLSECLDDAFPPELGLGALVSRARLGYKPFSPRLHLGWPSGLVEESGHDEAAARLHGEIDGLQPDTRTLTPALALTNLQASHASDVA